MIGGLILLLSLVSLGSAQEMTAIGTEFDPNHDSLKPSEEIIEQKKVFKQSTENAPVLEVGDQQEEPSIVEMDEEERKKVLAALNQTQRAQEEVIENREQDFYDEQQKQHLEELPQWLKTEEKAKAQVTTLPQNFESFNVILEDAEHMLFAMDNLNRFDHDNKIYVQIKVYVEDNGEYNVPNRPAEETYISFVATTNPSNWESGTLVQKAVYIHTILELPKRPMIHLGFYNGYGRKVFVAVALQKMIHVIQPVNSQHVDPVVSKIKQIAQSISTEDSTYKWQMNFKRKSDKQQRKFLILTCVQLGLIVLTTLVQISCIKSLMNNKVVV